MNRRQLLRASVATVVLGLHTGRSAIAKDKQKIGVLIWGSPTLFGGLLRKDLEESMAGLGFVDGRNVSYEWRYAKRDFARVPIHAAELVRLAPDVIVTRLDLTTEAVARLTTTIPIVAFVGDPVMGGYSQDGVLPSRNVTGLNGLQLERTGKALETLKSIIPGISRIAIVAAKADPQFLDGVGQVENYARRLGLEPHTTLVASSAELESAFASMRANGIPAAKTIYASAYTDSLEELATRHGVALIGSELRDTERGSLVSLYAEFENDAAGSAAYRQAAQVAKILRGISVSQIPFEFPRKFVLSINLKTARALGLRIPQEVLLRADRIIE